ncbi:hypothetical protein [Achromobacter spanius]|uniref:Uncharacterized protein n=2 Tax=Achromobacter TaxID=222 RepID=A0ABY8GU87_9BURK|nr:hypothetical protein [Achromobacter spanius]WAI82669.1 hypothetical protein N8Z00_24675 [Achromobacter spanius]WFP08093.1 hypothetical protein P8T11_27985 [Achromobacter spanius]
MQADTYADSPSHRLEIAAGASRDFVLRAGATLICVAGSVRLEERVADAQATGSVPLPVAVRLNSGEAHALVDGGVVRVTAINAADVICLEVPDPISRFFKAATRIFRLKVLKSSNKGLGALHKIS